MAEGNAVHGYLTPTWANQNIVVMSIFAMTGGNMVQFVTKRRETKSLRGGLCIDEDEARYYFLQLLSAVEYCHKHHVAHRYG